MFPPSQNTKYVSEQVPHASDDLIQLRNAKFLFGQHGSRSTAPAFKRRPCTHPSYSSALCSVLPSLQNIKTSPEQLVDAFHGEVSIRNVDYHINMQV